MVDLEDALDEVESRPLFSALFGGAGGKASSAAAKKGGTAVAAATSALETLAKNLRQIIDLEKRAERAGLKGVDLINKAHEQELKVFRDMLDQKTLTAEDFDRAMFALEVLRGEKIDRLNQEVEKKRLDEQKRLADKLKLEQDRLAAEQARPFIQAAENIQQGFSDAFTQIFKDGEFNFQSLADRMKDIFARLFAELATIAIIRPIIAPIVTGAAGLLGLSGSQQGGILSALGLGAAAGGAASSSSSSGILGTIGAALAGTLQFVKDGIFNAALGLERLFC